MTNGVFSEASVATKGFKTERKRVPGAQLKAAREACGMSQETLADLLQVRGPTISERENMPTVAWDTWLAVAHVLNLADDWGPVQAKPKPAPAKQPVVKAPKPKADPPA